ncbi:hypothetical protein ER308_13240 [Egibacter rhizosphaerae]|uniref:YdbS-like PH domain-containing protein n=1 Tax=Egibacter rhizosphaerae TaxID=1670831 RepID=A0A411YGR2_9ACTN|nr:PH domain-containing protein [Egibacter rhizosphaerae]QBI20434.1 hypothetical protein ER308_13240 [Egibacter rhizosphaerae]
MDAQEPPPTAEAADAPAGPPSLPDADPGTGDGIPELVPLDPRVRKVWWLTGFIFVLQGVIVAGVVDLLAPLPTPTGLLTGAVLAGGTALAIVLPIIRYRRWGYALRERDLWIRHGVFWRNVSVIPYARLQFVDTRAGPLDRLFGLAQLVVHTAALGTSGQLPGLDSAEAERLRERLASVEADILAV